MVDAIIISDLHLGSYICRADKIKLLLEKILHGEILTKNLILNGDIFDSHDLRRLKKSHWKVLSLIRKLSDKINVIWIAGNHDGPYDTISALIGTEAKEELVLISGNQEILILHGDKFDEVVSKRPKLTFLADKIYRTIQKYAPSLARSLKRKSKIYLRCIDLIKKRAIQYSKYDAVICGHSHHAESSHPYYNSGSFTDEICNYLIINQGNVILTEI